MSYPETLPADISSTVRRALSEDIGTGDLTAKLVPADKSAEASVICREDAVLCGTAWFDETFLQLDTGVAIHWHYADGDLLKTNDTVCTLQGASRALLSGERTALNFIQLLSATATVTRQYVSLLQDSHTRLLDTRKTLPGLRTAQKYAVACGGGSNHRMGLYDAMLIKENHIHEAGSITDAVTKAKKYPGKIEVEVEGLAQLQEAIEAGADTILLDNFSLEMMAEAVQITGGRATLEASGAVDATSLGEIAATGVDYISVGALTKNIRAIDFSMRIK